MHLSILLRAFKILFIKLMLIIMAKSLFASLISIQTRQYIYFLHVPLLTNFRKDDLSSAEMVFHREATRAQRDHVCSHKKEIVNHSVLIFQPSEEVR